MPLFQTIYERFKRKPSLDRLPFEELAERYKSEPVAVLEEFVRRMQPLVFQAALDLETRLHPPASNAEVEEMALKVFEDFTPEFMSGDPSMVLVRFAAAIRRVLDDEAFEAIATRYYHQLLLYHVKDDQQRRFLSASYQKRFGPTPEEDMAQRFQVTVDEARRIIRNANRSLQDVIESDFTEDELSEMTEGRIRRRH
jgi:hypothetical protein